MGELIVIPQSKSSIVASIKNGEIIEIGKIDISFNSKSIITKNNLIVSLCFNSKTLNIHNKQGDLLLQKENVKYSAINFKDNCVYLGGEYDRVLGRNSLIKGEMFSIINLEELNFRINTIELPIKEINGKSIDDILINGTDLILVDNIIYPKYLIKYDISSPNLPKHVGNISLPNNGTYEHIIKGDINNDWIILFSSTVGREGSNQHITVNGKTQGHQSLHHPFPSDFVIENSEKVSEKLVYLDISLINDRLYILRNDGLGYVDLNKRISNKNFKRTKTKNSNFERIIKTKCERLIAINKSGYELIDK